jgi:hypothetical protein
MNPLKERISTCLFGNVSLGILCHLKVFPNLGIDNRMRTKVSLEATDVGLGLHLLLAMNVEANQQESFPHDLVSC